MNENLIQKQLTTMKPDAIQAFKKKFRYTNLHLATLLGVEEITIQRYSTGTNDVPLWLKYALVGLESRPIHQDFLRQRGGAEQIEMEIARHNTLQQIKYNYLKIPLKDIYGIDGGPGHTIEEMNAVRRKPVVERLSRRQEIEKAKQEESRSVLAAIEDECGPSASVEEVVAEISPGDSPLNPEEQKERAALVAESRLRKERRRQLAETEGDDGLGVTKSDEDSVVEEEEVGNNLSEAPSTDELYEKNPILDADVAEDDDTRTKELLQAEQERLSNSAEAAPTAAGEVETENIGAAIPEPLHVDRVDPTVYSAQMPLEAGDVEKEKPKKKPMSAEDRKAFALKMAAARQKKKLQRDVEQATG